MIYDPSVIPCWIHYFEWHRQLLFFDNFLLLALGIQQGGLCPLLLLLHCLPLA